MGQIITWQPQITRADQTKLL